MKRAAHLWTALICPRRRSNPPAAFLCGSRLDCHTVPGSWVRYFAVSVYRALSRTAVFSEIPPGRVTAFPIPPYDRRASCPFSGPVRRCRVPGIVSFHSQLRGLWSVACPPLGHIVERCGRSCLIAPIGAAPFGRYPPRYRRGSRRLSFGSGTQESINLQPSVSPLSDWLIGTWRPRRPRADGWGIYPLRGMLRVCAGFPLAFGAGPGSGPVGRP